MASSLLARSAPRGLPFAKLLKDVSEAEAKTRIELAAAYRLFEHQKLNEDVHNHLSAKIVEDDGSEAFLINPFGLTYNEITASSLIKIDLDGNVLGAGTMGDTFGVNQAGFVIHSAIHRARPDVKSVMHSHYPAAAGVSAVKQGLLELAQTTHQVGPVAYHDYNGVVVDMDEQKSLVHDLGKKNILFLRNHGTVTAGESIGAAWYSMYQLTKAAEIQSNASACALGDRNNLLIPPEKFIDKTFTVVSGEAFGGAAYGQKEFSAYMPLLDRQDPSYRT